MKTAVTILAGLVLGVVVGLAILAAVVLLGPTPSGLQPTPSPIASPSASAAPSAAPSRSLPPSPSPSASAGPSSSAAASGGSSAVRLGLPAPDAGLQLAAISP